MHLPNADKSCRFLFNISIFVRFLNVVWRFVGFNPVSLAQPFAEIDIGAACAAERPEFFNRRFLAYGTGFKHGLGHRITHG